MTTISTAVQEPQLILPNKDYSANSLIRWINALTKGSAALNREGDSGEAIDLLELLELLMPKAEQLQLGAS